MTGDGIKGDADRKDKLGFKPGQRLTDAMVIL